MKSQRRKIIIISIVVILFITIGVFFFLMYPFNKKASTGTTKNPLIQSSINKKEAIELDMKRGMEWGLKKEEVINRESLNYSEFLSEGSRYITYAFTQVFDQESLLTYLFDTEEQLIGMVYEQVLNDIDRKELTLIQQNTSSYIIGLLEEPASNQNKWTSHFEKIYDNNLWSQSLVDGELEQTLKWDNGDIDDVYLFTSSFPVFDFLFVQTDEFSLGNQAVLIVSDQYIKENNLESILEIKPKLTSEQTKEKETNLFENSLNEDASKTSVAQSNDQETIKIVQFDKVKDAVMIVNTTKENIDMTGYYLETDSGQKYFFEDGFIIKANERVSIHAPGQDERFTNGVSTLLLWDNKNPIDDKSDQVTLYNGNKKISTTK